MRLRLDAYSGNLNAAKSARRESSLSYIPYLSPHLKTYFSCPQMKHEQ